MTDRQETPAAQLDQADSAVDRPSPAAERSRGHQAARHPLRHAGNAGAAAGHQFHDMPMPVDALQEMRRSSPAANEIDIRL